MASSTLFDSIERGLKGRSPKRLGASPFRTLACGSAAVRTPRSPSGVSGVSQKRAAVAVVLRRRCGRAEVLLIKRAVSPRDPWSGDVALPGGRVEDRETDLDAALRECREEVGLTVSGGGFRLLGQLDDRTVRRSSTSTLILSAFVFMETLGDGDDGGDGGSVGVGSGGSGSGGGFRRHRRRMRPADAPLALQASEVACAWWADLGALLSSGPPAAHAVPLTRSMPSLRASPRLQVRTLEEEKKAPSAQLPMRWHSFFEVETWRFRATPWPRSLAASLRVACRLHPPLLNPQALARFLGLEEVAFPCVRLVMPDTVAVPPLPSTGAAAGARGGGGDGSGSGDGGAGDATGSGGNGGVPAGVVLWGLTLGVLCDLGAVACGDADMGPDGGPDKGPAAKLPCPSSAAAVAFEFPRAHWAVAAAARAATARRAPSFAAATAVAVAAVAVAAAAVASVTGAGVPSGAPFGVPFGTWGMVSRATRAVD